MVWFLLLVFRHAKYKTVQRVNSRWSYAGAGGPAGIGHVYLQGSA